MKRWLENTLSWADWTLFMVGLALGIVLNAFLSLIINDLNGFLESFAPEIVGIVFTVIILERFAKRREIRQQTEQLVARVHSRYNSVAREAVEELRALGKLKLQWIDLDTQMVRTMSLLQLKRVAGKHRGALYGRELRGSNWQDANFYQVDLRHVDMTNAKLYKADLVQANLEGATVKEEQLASTDVMLGAIMPDGTRYDGRFCLAGDIKLAKEWGYDPLDDLNMAEYYGVTPAEYRAGRIYWDENKHRFQIRATDYDSNSTENRIG